MAETTAQLFSRARFITILRFFFGVFFSVASVWILREQSPIWMFVFCTCLMTMLIYTIAPDKDKFLIGFFIFLIPIDLNLRLFDLPSLYEYHYGGATSAIRPSDIPLAILAIRYLVSQGLSGKCIPRFDTFDKVFALFILLTLPSVVIAPYKAYGILELLRLIKMYFLVLIIKQYITEEKQLSLFIKIISLEDGSTVKIETGLVNSNIGDRLDWSTDGERFVFVGGKGESREFWVMENFLPQDLGM